jgi:hypothetical protein
MNKTIRVCTACMGKVPSGYISGCCHAAVSILTVDARGIVLDRKTATAEEER